MNTGLPGALGVGLNVFAVGRSPARVLLVEDEPRLLSSLQAMLGGKGLEISSATNGAEALDLLNAIPFDLAILDLGLPDMSGHAIMDAMNAKQLGVNVIVTSGDSGIESAIGALKRGAFDYLRKPYTREELFRTVDNALRQRRLLAENQRMTQQLETSERKHRNLVDSSPDIIFTLDPQGLFTFINRRVQNLLGFTAEEMLGHHYSKLIHVDDLKRARHHAPHVADLFPLGGQRIVAPFIRRLGEGHEVHRGTLAAEAREPDLFHGEDEDGRPPGGEAME